MCITGSSCLTLCDPVNCSLPGSSVHGILQARILEWVAIPFSRGSLQPRDWTWVSQITGRFFTIWDTREAYKKRYFCVIKLISHAIGRKTFSWIPPEQAFSLLTFQGCVYTPTPCLLSLPLSVLLQDIFIELSKLDVSDTLKAMAVVAS